MILSFGAPQKRCGMYREDELKNIKGIRCYLCQKMETLGSLPMSFLTGRVEIIALGTEFYT